MIPQYEPWVDRENLAKEMNDYILSGGWFTEYKKTEEFEKKLAQFLKVQYCSVVNNGTISLSLALLAEGIKVGDQVLIPAMTMYATQAAVELIGAIPVFVDINSVNLCMDLDKARNTIKTNPKIRALIYVTLNGRSHSINDLVEFYNFCYSKGVYIVEDNAQSFGSLQDDNIPVAVPPIGIGSFSFSMPKIITTGQGGCLVTDVPFLARRIRKLKDFGRNKSGVDIHDDFGINSKFTELQAILGLSQLKNITQRIKKKKAIYWIYKNLLKDISEVKFLETNLDFVTPWFIDIYVLNREKLQEFLLKEKIQTRNIYPSLSKQEVNKKYSIWGMDVAEEVASEGLWLPSSMQMEPEEVYYVCERIKEFYIKE